jgi:serine/threonine protein kinase
MTEHGKAIEQLWLSYEWYIPVDAAGECQAESAEGALGYVIKLVSQRNPNNHLALKMPRLLGDTHRENAYICQLMEQELAAANQVFTGSSGMSTQGLLPIHPIGGLGGSPLRGRIATENEWKDSLIFVRFDKGRKPIFCLVRKNSEGKLQFHPPSFNQNPTAPIRDVQMFDEIMAQHRFLNVIFVNNDHSEVGVNMFGIDDALKHDAMGITWYTGLPSVVYGWAPGTLQESISRGTRDVPEPWSLGKHLQLTRVMCQALRNLHMRGLIHADLRPANILVQGDAADPNDYKLTDYGSFAYNEVTGAQPSGLDSSGATKLPVLVGERASAFYAPERRLGREREAADTAVIKLNSDDRYTLILGWKSDLCPEGIVDESKIDRYLDQAVPAADGDEYPDAVLLPGDRIQIRDFIFELDGIEKRFNDKQILECDSQCWQIFHGKIAVSSTHVFRDSLTVIPIPRSIELQKWSAATDIYSLGTLLLYSLFRSSIQTDGNDTALQSANSSQLEDEFREMLTYLNSRPYFESIWPELDWLRFCMERELISGRHHAQSFAQTQFDGLNTSKRDTDQERPKDLRLEAIRFTNRLTQTSPGIYRLVRALDNNVALFVFVIHFALSCVHRRSHLQADRLKQEGHEDWKQELPFCEHRLERPNGENAAAQRALNRIDYLTKNVIDKAELSLMKPNPSNQQERIVNYDPRPDYNIRIQLDNEKEKTQALQEELQATQDQVQNVQNELVATQVQLEISRDTLQATEETLKATHDTLNTTQDTLHTTQTALQQIRQQVDGRWGLLAKPIREVLDTLPASTLNSADEIQQPDEAAVNR